MDKWIQELFDVIGRSREVSRQSKGASVSVISGEEMVTIPLKEYKTLLNEVGQLRNSKAASPQDGEETIRMPLKEYRELLINKTMRKSKAASGVNQAKVIHDFLLKGH